MIFKVDPLSAHLVNLRGKEWKSLRAKITPIFSSGKIKAMFNALVECGVPLKEYISRCAVDGKAIDIKETLAGYTTDVIGLLLQENFKKLIAVHMCN